MSKVTSWRTVIDNQTVANQLSVDSDAINVMNADSEIGVKITIDSGTTPNVKLVYQVSDSGQGLATLVGGAGDAKDGISWEKPEVGGTIIDSIVSESKKTGHTIMPTNWMRLRVTGIGGNGADVKVTVRIAIRENV